MVMRPKVYIRITGENFNFEKFQHQAGSQLGGEICWTKKMVDGKSVNHNRFWRSAEVSVDEDGFWNFLRTFKSLVGDTDFGASVLDFVVIKRCGGLTQGSGCGMYLSPETVACMADIRAGLDYDLYCDGFE